MLYGMIFNTIIVTQPYSKMKAIVMTKSINEGTTKSRNILVPTIRHKPLRMKQFPKKNSVALVTEITSPPSNQDNPFLYFSLSTNTLDGQCYALENIDDGSDANNEAERRTRFPVEVHPLYDAMLGTFVRDLQGRG